MSESEERAKEWGFIYAEMTPQERRVTDKARRGDAEARGVVIDVILERFYGDPALQWEATIFAARVREELGGPLTDPFDLGLIKE